MQLGIRDLLDQCTLAWLNQVNVTTLMCCVHTDGCKLAAPVPHHSPSLSRPSSADDGSRHAVPMPPGLMSNGHSRPSGNDMQVHGLSNGMHQSSEAGTLGDISAFWCRIIIIPSSDCALSLMHNVLCQHPPI